MDLYSGSFCIETPAFSYALWSMISPSRLRLIWPDPVPYFGSAEVVCLAARASDSCRASARRLTILRYSSVHACVPHTHIYICVYMPG